MALRQLSDPDFGFHLKYGKWIVENHQIPSKDLSTYTVPGHEYVDLHWLFQVITYGVYKLTGYNGVSLFFCFITLLLSLLLIIRNRVGHIPLPITCFLLLFSFLLIDSRLAPRPEMFSFLFLTLVIFILDIYRDTHRTYLYLLPVIFLFWCNMHSLYILGLIVLATYLFSQLWYERKFDKTLLLWSGTALLVCFFNPFGIRGFAFPMELLSRFDPRNVYNQHIQEFMPFFARPRFVARDYIFLFSLALTLVLMILTWRRRRVHEIILIVVFAFLAINSIRNIPLFALVAFPVLSRSLSELKPRLSSPLKKTRLIFYIIMIILPIAVASRVLTNSWYIDNNSFNKTGMGVDDLHQPAEAAAFLVRNHLDGRILNSLGFGGWLSWTIPQPIFIDGRLEVMQDSLYREITSSWEGNLSKLIDQHKPVLIIYNYLKYYPWTFQLKEMPDWRLIYVDGIAVIFASRNYAPEIPAVNLSTIPSKEMASPPQNFVSWMKGFYRPTDYQSLDEMHKGLFRFQMSGSLIGKMNAGKAVIIFNRANEKYKSGNFKGAIIGYDSAITLYPEYAKAYNNRGIIRAFELKDYSRAKMDFDKALELSPEYADAWLNRGIVWFYLHNPEAACSDWNHARQLGNPRAARLIELHCNRE